MIKSLVQLFSGYEIPLIIAIILSYLFGSISFSIIVTRIFKKNADIRDMGSGNAGTTNVLRSIGRVPAVITFIGDFSKCVIAVFFSRLIFNNFTYAPELTVLLVSYLSGIACIMGHLFPCFYGFRGGKGVLTTAAMVLIIDWRVFLILFVIFAVVFLLSRIVSLSSIAAASLYPFATFIVTYFIDYKNSIVTGIPLSYVWVVTFLTLIVAITVVWKHSENIKRLKEGTEKKISLRRSR